MDSNPSSPDDETTIGRRRSDGVAPPTATDYLNPDYWNRRFSEEEHYEWFKGYSHFRDLLLKHLLPNHSVLEISCGNSQLCEELHRDGFKNLTCIDLSAVAVDRLQKKLSAIGLNVYSVITGIKVLEADMLDLPFASESFDVVIEKGAMDVLFVDSGDPWNPRPSTVDKVMAMLEGVHRVLKPDGIFISISFGQPHFRRRLFESPGFTWSVNWNTFGDGFHYFFYTLKKGERPSGYKASGQISDIHSPSLFHEKLEDEDYIFQIAVEELNT